MALSRSETSRTSGARSEFVVKDDDPDSPYVILSRGKNLYVKTRYNPGSAESVNEILAGITLHQQARITEYSALVPGEGPGLTPVGYNAASLATIMDNAATRGAVGSTFYKTMLVAVLASAGKTLDAFHAVGVYHGRVSPDTIYVGFDDPLQATSAFRAFGSNRGDEDPVTAVLAGDLGNDAHVEMLAEMTKKHLRVTLVDLGSAVVLDALADKHMLPIPRNGYHLDPWLMKSDGDVRKYNFAGDFPRVQAAAALQAADYWAFGTTAAGAMSASTPWFTSPEITPSRLDSGGNNQFNAVLAVADQNGDAAGPWINFAIGTLAEQKSGGFRVQWGNKLAKFKPAVEKLLRYQPLDRLEPVKAGGENFTPLGAFAGILDALDATS